MDTRDVSPLVERFLRLLEGGTDDEQFQSPAEMLCALWREDATACEGLLEQFLRQSGDVRDILDQIGIAEIEIGEAGFRDVLYALSKRRGVARQTKARLHALLVSLGHSGAVGDFDGTFRSGCNRFLKGELDEQELYSLVRQACILRRCELRPTITSTLDELGRMKGRRPHLHIDTRRSIETVEKALCQGRDAALDILFSDRSKISQKEAAAFALGCERDPALFDVLVRAYAEHDGWHDFPVRRECVGAIVYSARLTDALRFVATGLQRERTRLGSRWKRWFWLSSRDADILRLLLAAFYCPKTNEQLQEELRKWLQVKEDDYVAFAYLALERHGITDPAFERAHARAISRERRFREQHFYFSELMCLRRDPV